MESPLLRVTGGKSYGLGSESDTGGQSSRTFPLDDKSDYEDAHDQHSPLLSRAKDEESCVDCLRRVRSSDISLECVKTVLLHPNMKIFWLTAVMIAAIVMFLYTPETAELCGLHLASVSTDYPYEWELDTSAYLCVVDVAFDAPVTSSRQTITVELQALNSTRDNATWTTIDNDNIWDVQLGPSLIVELIENTHDFRITEEDKSLYDAFRVHFTTTSQVPIGLNVEVLQLSSLVDSEVVIAALILFFVYFLIVFELLHRTIAALVGSFIALAFLSIVRARPSLELVITWIDFETIGLLFGMMVMVGIFSNTGFFEWSAIKAFKLAKGDLWKLTTYLCLFTAVVSAFLDNVTTILLLTPVTIRLCKVLDVPAVPMLLAEVMYSNLGGTATAIGDPPNIIIVNDRRILQYSEEVNFGSFMIHVAPGVILAMFVVYWLIRYIAKPQMVRQPHQGILMEIEIWEKSKRRINPLISEEDQHVYELLEKHIAVLKSQLGQDKKDEVVPIDISDLENKYRIRDPSLFVSSCLVLGTVILFFFLHSAVGIDITLAWIALIGAMVHLIVGNIHEVDEILEKVELSTLLFFAGLFVLMRALEEMGLIEFIATIVEDLIGQVKEPKSQLALAVTLILWVSALISAFIDNIPFTTTMVPVVVELHKGLGLPLGPLVWALSMGACFGGNGTLIGASANVVCVGLAEAERIKISFTTFFKFGFPVMILSVVVAHIYLLIFHVAIPWYVVYDYDSNGQLI